MPDEKNNPDRRSLGEGGCPSCADHPMGKALPGSTANVLVREYVPPTAAELDFSRNFYAAMEARTGRSPFTDGIPVQTQDASPGLRDVALRDGMTLPDISGLPMDPQGPAAMSMRHATPTPGQDTMATEAIHRAMRGEHALMPSQLTAPWFSRLTLEEDDEDDESGRSGRGYWRASDYSRTDGPYTTYWPPIRNIDEDLAEYPDPTDAMFLRAREGLNEPPEAETVLACPTRKSIKYKFDYHWREIIAVGVAKDEKEARELAEASIAGSSAMDSEASATTMESKAVEALSNGTGLKCAPDCRLAVEFIASRYRIYVGLLITGGDGDESEFQVTRHELHDVEAVIKVSCIE